MWEGIQFIIRSKSKTFLAFCFCFIAGAGGASLFDWLYGLAFYFYCSFFLVLFFLIVVWQYHLIRFGTLCILFFCFGIWRFTITTPNCSDPSVLCHYNGRKITLHGFVSAEPDRRVDQARYTIAVQSVDVVGANGRSPLQSITGRVLITARLYPEFHYGDTLKISCRIDYPENNSDGTFRYDKYLARYGVYSVCGNPIIDQTSAGANQSPARYLMTQLFVFKSIVQTHLSQLWSEPDSSFMAGILFGSKSGLPPEISDAFNKTGVTHIIAVSGFNVTIIVTALMFVLIRLRLYHQQAFWAIVLFIISFVLFTGATASVLRAGVMGLLVLIAQQLGRLSRITNVLIFSAAVMLLGNPYLLVWDAGFQLSFLATIGLVYLSPIVLAIERKGVWQYVPAMIWETFAQTFSAIIATLPLILYQFGRLSIVAPLVNVLVLWIIAWLMLGGFVALVISFIYFPLAQLVAYITDLGLKYVLFVVEFFGKQSWSAVELSVPWWTMAGMYVLLIFYTRKIENKIKNRESQS